MRLGQTIPEMIAERVRKEVQARLALHLGRKPVLADWDGISYVHDRALEQESYRLGQVLLLQTAWVSAGTIGFFNAEGMLYATYQAPLEDDNDLPSPSIY